MKITKDKEALQTVYGEYVSTIQWFCLNCGQDNLEDGVIEEVDTVTCGVCKGKFKMGVM